MTYKEIKLASMQKMFHDIVSLEINKVTKPFLDKMVYVVNSAILRACAAGCAKRKTLQITRVSVPNIIENSDEYQKVIAVVSNDIKLYAKCGLAYCVNVSGKGKFEIHAGGVLLKTVSFDTGTGFERFKGLIENESGKPVEITFLKGMPYLFSYPAVYDVPYESESDVCDNDKYITFDLKELTSDFYRFDSERCVEEICSSVPVSYRFFNESTIEIRGDVSGSWCIPYYAYPNVITDDTPDDETIDLPYELCVLLPFYIASELYLEDDSGLSISWRNKFESSLAEYTQQKRKGAKRKVEVVGGIGDFYGRV